MDAARHGQSSTQRPGIVRQAAKGRSYADPPHASLVRKGLNKMTINAGEDPGQPYLFVDLYSRDDGRLIGGQPNWQVLATTDNDYGAILKAWDGTRFNDGGWLRRHWPAVRDAGGDRYGDNWFRGAYLFLEFLQDGADQADAYLKAV